jgi:hypothetical protein
MGRHANRSLNLNRYSGTSRVAACRLAVRVKCTPGEKTLRDRASSKQTLAILIGPLPELDCPLVHART